jgi:hypothetical protein
MKAVFWIVALSAALGSVAASAADYQSPRSHYRDGVRQARAMHYYSPYPWWWNQPYAPRVITSYVKWQNTYYERPYDAPHPNGVIGYTVIGPFW